MPCSQRGHSGVRRASEHFTFPVAPFVGEDCTGIIGNGKSTANLLHSGMGVETRHVKYAFADVVDFTKERTVEAQVEIVAQLGRAFKAATQQYTSKVIFLPTGDGICAGIIDPNAPADAHLKVALSVIQQMAEWSETVQENRKCTVRFGLNESVDNVIIDINGQRNLSGAGINQAQRVMSIADGNQILLAPAAYDTLKVRDEYETAFWRYRVEVKHGHVLTAFQFRQDGIAHLDIGIPEAVRSSDPIALDLTEALADSKNQSTSGMVACVHGAIEKYEARLNEILAEFRNSPTGEKNLLDKAHQAWSEYRQLHGEWLHALRQKLGGTMFRVLGANEDSEILCHRLQTLVTAREEWMPDPEYHENAPADGQV